ncbi:MAG: right-handed parallel beta-helix repeat-containing protein [Methanotrichaceae archaeon]|nr:right-handed parallel beta-helix repeat-containing protein [Methanotrichaceae archaeon]
MSLLYFIILIMVNASVQASLITVNSGDSIQGAISVAHPGDTILVEKGIYYEHLQVSKPIALNGIGFPVLDATASGSAVTISADGVIFEGFRIINSGSLQRNQNEAAIKVHSNNNTLKSNDISNNFNGILIQEATGNRVYDNILTGNLGYGIRLRRASNNTIYGNIFEDNFGSNVFDDGLNRWDHNNSGNFYSDFDSPDKGCFDENRDGFCDSTHAIPGGLSVDMRPLSRIFGL